MTNIIRKIGKSVPLALGAIVSLTQVAQADFVYNLPAPATETYHQSTDVGHFSLPLTPWSATNGVASQMVTGSIDNRSYRMDGTSLTLLQIAEPIRQTLLDQGYKIELDCTATTCGGFDFRRMAPVNDPPYIFVDLRDFYALSALNGPNHGVFVLISRFGMDAYLQITTIGTAQSATSQIPQTAIAKPVATTPKAAQNQPPQILDLTRLGSITLDDLRFESGSSKLGAGSYDSLAAIATFLKENPKAVITLVGHSDSVGSLSGNIAISQQRAASVRQWLIAEYQVSPKQVDAQGVGFLAPITTNNSPLGRGQNRRVVAVLTSDPE